jgi:hypothetical protein
MFSANYMPGLILVIAVHPAFTGVPMTEFRGRIEEEIPRLRRYARALTHN